MPKVFWKTRRVKCFSCQETLDSIGAELLALTKETCEDVERVKASRRSGVYINTNSGINMISSLPIAPTSNVVAIPSDRCFYAQLIRNDRI